MRGFETDSIILWAHAQQALKTPPHALGVTESGLLRDSFDREKALLDLTTGGFDPGPLYESSGGHPGLIQKDARKVSGTHGESRR